MEALSAERVWRGLLPAPIGFSAGFAPASIALFPVERDSLGDAGPARLHQFAAGRWHARRALASLGLAEAPLLRRGDGAAQWPDGVVGSISHVAWGGRIFAIAAVARSVEIRALGVDLEPPKRIAPRHWQGVLTTAELDRVMSLAVPARGPAVQEIWCAKEAVAKASGRANALGEIETAFDAGTGDFAAAMPGASTAAFRGRVVTDSGWACAAVVCRRV